jgi:hypothetical protein
MILFIENNLINGYYYENNMIYLNGVGITVMGM